MRRAATALLICGSIASTFANESRKTEIVGQGAFPVSAEVSSLWLNGPSAGARPQPVIMVFYRGPAGWHDRKWQIDAKVLETPSHVSLKSPDLELSIEYGSGGHGVKVQGQDVDLKMSNVYLVTPVAQSGTSPSISGLGLIQFDVPKDANPAMYVLQSNPEIARRVLP